MSPFTPIATTRTTDQVVEQIRSAIGEGRFRHGERLPAERELAESFGVSRGVIREAIKILNGMGLIESRQGSGIFVQNDPVPVISQALTISLRREEQMIQHLFEIRIALETLAVKKATLHHTDADIARLRQFAPAPDATQPVPDLATAGLDDTNFHVTVANIAGNPYLQVLLQAIHSLVTTAFPVTEALREGMYSARVTHSSIVDAIVARDAATATSLMRQHLERSGIQAQATAKSQ